MLHPAKCHPPESTAMETIYLRRSLRFGGVSDCLMLSSSASLTVKHVLCEGMLSKLLCLQGRKICTDFTAIIDTSAHCAFAFVFGTVDCFHLLSELVHNNCQVE
ncbi:unnamed protein product [Allacma fusca]|uniref:Uncharacterized protein n=1 Tax=Allacma fusca TaxID=39272 RepID=A0A8J2JRP3_9HEXA|nr:unnamed protein product [Allacma fusca]